MRSIVFDVEQIPMGTVRGNQLCFIATIRQYGYSQILNDGFSSNQICKPWKRLKICHYYWCYGGHTWVCVLCYRNTCHSCHWMYERPSLQCVYLTPVERAVLSVYIPAIINDGSDVNIHWIFPFQEISPVPNINFRRLMRFKFCR